MLTYLSFYFLGMASHELVASPCNSEEELKNNLKNIVANPDSLEAAANQIYEGLLEDIITGIAFEMHQLNRLGGIPVPSEEDIKPFAIVENNETDIFGQQYAKIYPDCCCPICNRTISSSIIAPHLGNCLGMGRHSSRIASKRIANNCKENAYGGTSDDDNDYWVAGQEKPKLNKKVEGKKKKDKNGVRRMKTIKVVNDKNHTSKISEDYSQNTKYENVDSKN